MSNESLNENKKNQASEEASTGDDSLVSIEGDVKSWRKIVLEAITPKRHKRTKEEKDTRTKDKEDLNQGNEKDNEQLKSGSKGRFIFSKSFQKVFWGLLVLLILIGLIFFIFRIF